MRGAEQAPVGAPGEAHGHPRGAARADAETRDGPRTRRGAAWGVPIGGSEGKLSVALWVAICG